MSTKNDNDWLTSEAYTGAGSDAIPLDDQMGVGHLNARRAYQQFQPGESNSGGAAEPAIGWDYGFTDGFESITQYALAQPIAAFQFVSITLAWNREVFFEIDDGNPLEFDEGDTFLDDAVPIDLNLYLMPAGSTNVSQSVARSIATDTSVEHIFFEVQSAGLYEIWVEQVSGSLSQLQTYGLAWWTAAIPETGVPGDYSGNGTVGPEDYLAWKSAYGNTVTPGTSADGNGDGVVDAVDYTVWRNNLGSGSGSGGIAQVPEPSGLLLFTTAVTLAFLRRAKVTAFPAS